MTQNYQEYFSILAVIIIISEFPRCETLFSHMVAGHRGRQWPSEAQTGTTGTTGTYTKQSHRQESRYAVLQDPVSIQAIQRMKSKNVRPKSQAGMAETRPKKRFDWLRNI